MPLTCTVTLVGLPDGGVVVWASKPDVTGAKRIIPTNVRHAITRLGRVTSDYRNDYMKGVGIVPLSQRGTMMKFALFVVSVILASWAGVAVAQTCHTAARPSDPAPVSQVVRARIAGDFSLNEERTREIQVEAGKSYWLSAAGCPRMGNIRIAIVDAGGKTIKTDEGYSPSLCFSPERSGKYTIKVTATSLMRSYSWGSIDAALSDSECRK